MSIDYEFIIGTGVAKERHGARARASLDVKDMSYRVGVNTHVHRRDDLNSVPTVLALPCATSRCRMTTAKMTTCRSHRY